MKRIVLKSALLNGQEVKFNEAECVVDRIDSNSYILKDKKDGQRFKVYFREIKDIIESPKEQNHFPEVKEMVDQVADDGKENEEKPALKLRVGGVYRNKDKTKKRIIYYNEEHDWFISHEADIYKEDGECMYAANGLGKESYLSLIEEVQPAVVSVCDGCGAGKSELFLNGFCYACRQSDTEAVADIPTIAEKEAVEYCDSKTIPLGKHSSLRYKDPILQCQGCLELNLLTSPWKWCDRHSLIYKDFWSPDAECPACYYYESHEKLIVILQNKKEGNPFKVGETVNIFGANFVRGNYVAEVVKGIIESSTGNILRVRANNAVIACHYKQCERVE